MTEITADGIGEFISKALAELWTPLGHSGALSAKTMLRNTTIALCWSPPRVCAYWHGEVANPSAAEYLQTRARLDAHGHRINDRKAKVDAKRAAFETVRVRFVETHSALGRLAPPAVNNRDKSMGV